MRDDERGAGSRVEPTRQRHPSADDGSRVLSRYRRPLAISVAAATGLYLIAIWLSDGQAVMNRLELLPGWVVAAALLLPSVGFLTRFWRWDIFLRSLGHRVPFLDHLRIYIAGFALTTTPAKVGENLRAIYLTGYEVPASDSFAAFVVERLGDVLAMLLLSSLVIGLQSGYEWVIALMIGGTVIAMVVLRHPDLPTMIRSRGSPETAIGRLIHGLSRSLASAGDLLSTRLLAGGVALALVAWSTEAVTFSLLARQIGIEIPFLVGMGIFAVATLVGAVSFLPGGVGPTEAIMVGLLVLSGATAPSATAVTVVIRVFTLWWAVVLGIVALVALGRPSTRTSGGADDA